MQPPLIDLTAPSRAAAVIFVGGGGRRLGGVPKWLIEINGEPLLARALRLGAALSDEVILLAGPEGECLWDEPRVAARTARLLEALRGELSDTLSVELRVYRESPITHQGGAHRSGPLTALCAALSLSQRSWLWALACDTPLLTLELLAPLARHLAPGTLASLYTTPARGEREGAGEAHESQEAQEEIAHPLAGLWSRAALPLARAQLEGGSLRRLCAHERVQLQRAPDPALMLNLNTPQDLLWRGAPCGPSGDPSGDPSSRLHFTLPLLS